MNSNNQSLNIKEKALILFNSIFKNLRNNKNKLIISFLFFGVFYYFYKKYIFSKLESAIEIYKSISECKEFFNDNNNSFDQVLIQYEPCFKKLNKKLLSEIKYKLNSVFNLEDLYNKVKSAKREEMLITWTNLKNKVLISYFTSLIISRFVILISQSHLLIIEKMQIDNHKISKNICDDLLTDLWIFAIKYLSNLIEYIEELICEEIASIPISNQFSWKTYSKQLNLLQEKILDLIINNFNHEIKLKLFRNYVNEIANKINLLERNNFNLDLESQKIEVFLKFYQIYYDILNSNLFHVILLKAINNDFKNSEKDIKFRFESIVLEEIQQVQNNLNKNISTSEEVEKNIDYSNIKNNSEENSMIMINEINIFKIKFLKIIIIMLKINENLLDINSSILINKTENSDKRFNEELIEYFKIIYD
jgi:hypothetical protein